MTAGWNPEEKSALAGLLRLLSIRDRSEKELHQYLVKKQSLSKEQIDKLISYLHDNQLINDADFSKKWISARVRQGKGERIIVQELKLKGIESQLISKTLNQITESSWFEGMDKIIAKTNILIDGQLSYQEKAKIYQKLYQRGYPSRLIDAYLTSKVE